MKAEAVLAAIVAAMVAPSETQGAWSPPLRLDGSSHASEVSLAVNGTGQVGTAWVGAIDGVTVVHAAIGARSHTLVRSRFDGRGRGRLAGITDRGSAASSGVLFTAAGPRRPFRGPRTVAAAPATHLRFATTTLGRAPAAWVGAP